MKTREHNSLAIRERIYNFSMFFQLTLIAAVDLDQQSGLRQGNRGSRSNSHLACWGESW